MEGYYAVVVAATAVAGFVEFAVAADRGWDEVSRCSPYSAGPKPSSPPQPPRGSAPHPVGGW